jgi:hypothetical protein
MIVGFTGTRAGCTTEQYESLQRLLAGMNIEEFHHGSCLGADTDAARIVRSLGAIRIVAHPGVSARGGANPMLSQEALDVSNEILCERAHFSRNRQIIQVCDVLVACPRLDTEETNGGTWYTINHARKVGKRVIIVWPDGKVEEQDWRQE